MRTLFLLFLSTLLFSGCDSTNADADHDDDSLSPVEIHGQLRVEGNRIVDKNGDTVMLRGMSLFWSQWMGQYYSATTVQWLREDWRVNVVRAAMGVHGGGYIENPDVEKRKVEIVIDAAIEAGIYVVVDWHAHNPEAEAAASFFAKIAAKYGDQPNIIYETWNEPLNTHDWATVIKPYHESVVPEIRKHDPDNLIILGTQTWSQDVDKAAAEPVDFDNIAYALHFYAGTHGASLRAKAEAALSKGVALMVTEWGTSEANGDGHLAVEETRVWLNFMDANELSWCNWSVADKDEISAALLPGAPGIGSWPDRMISASGLLVREELREKNP